MVQLEAAGEEGAAQLGASALSAQTPAQAPNVYATPADYKLERGLTGDDDDVGISDALDAASRAVDQFCQRRFSLGGVETRTYGGDGYALLLWRVGDLWDAQEVEADGVALARTAWHVEPRQTDPPLEPARVIVLRDSATSIKVTGRWGWGVVPAAIKRATMEIAALDRLESPRATREVNEFGQVRATTRDANSIGREILGAYVAPRLLP